MASKIEALYRASPVWLQQVAVAAWGVGWYRRRFNHVFHRLVREFHERDYWTPGQFCDYQRVQLARVLESAWKSLHYRAVFRKAGIRESMDPLEALAVVPLLSKETLRARGRQLLSQKRLPRGTKVMKTSGTTGTPSEIFYTREFHSLLLAVNEARNLHVAGVTYRDRSVMFGARKVCRFDQDRPPFWRFSPIENLAYASIYHLSPRFLPAYVAFLRCYKPVLVTGYPTALHAISRYVLEHDGGPLPARCVSTHSEMVSEQARKDMEAAFQCRLLDTYGAVENCLFAGQCEYGRYHVSPDVGIVEILDPDGKPVAEGVPGEVVCTGLHNTLQPVIRYRIGDAARWSAEQNCQCGRQTPILEAIEGRTEDVCVTVDGRQVSRFTYVFKGMANVREAQVVQEKPDLFLVSVVASEEFSQRDAETIVNNMRVHVGDVEIRVERTTEIPRSASGKFRPVVCKLSSEQRCRLAGTSTLPSN